MCKDLEEHGIQVPPISLKNAFISGLGPDFHDIIKDLNRNRLDPDWHPILIRDLIEPTRSYLRLQQNLRAHHANYKSQTTPDTPDPNPTSITPQVKNDDNSNRIKRDRDRKRRIEQAITNGTFKLEDFQK